MHPIGSTVHRIGSHIAKYFVRFYFYFISLILIGLKAMQKYTSINKHFNLSHTDPKKTAKTRFLMLYYTCVITYSKLQMEI